MWPFAEGFKNILKWCVMVPVFLVWIICNLVTANLQLLFNNVTCELAPLSQNWTSWWAPVGHSNLLPQTLLVLIFYGTISKTVNPSSSVTSKCLSFSPSDVITWVSIHFCIQKCNRKLKTVDTWACFKEKAVLGSLWKHHNNLQKVRWH